MTFSVKAVLDDVDLQPFEFEDAEGSPRELPHLKTLTTRQAMRVFVHGELEEVLREIAPDLVDELMELPAHALDGLTTAWMEHSDVDLEPGKRSSSSRSSASTAARSRQTSRSGASKKSRR